MEVKVIHSCDDNPYYLDFWLPVSKTWKEKFNITPVLIHVGEENPSKEYGEVHTIPPDPNLPIHTQAQLARLWYPMHEPDTLWITSDIDMFPMSTGYWGNIVKEWENTKPIWTNLNSFYSDEYNGQYFPICYNISLGKNFKTILETDKSFLNFVEDGIKKTTVDTIHTPENWSGEDLHKWNIDETILTKNMQELISSGVYVHIPPRKPNARLNRTHWAYNEDMIRNGDFIDCHSIRPYSKYKIEIDKVLELIQ